MRDVRDVRGGPSIHPVSRSVRPGFILDNLPFDREILSAALTTQQGLRHVTIPEDFSEPAPDWAADYDKQMGRTPSAREPFTQYDAAMATLRTALHPAF